MLVKTTNALKFSYPHARSIIAVYSKGVRNTLLVIVAEHREKYGSLPALTEALRANESKAYRLVTAPL